MAVFYHGGDGVCVTGEDSEDVEVKRTEILLRDAGFRFPRVEEEGDGGRATELNRDTHPASRSSLWRRKGARDAESFAGWSWKLLRYGAGACGAGAFEDVVRRRRRATCRNGEWDSVDDGSCGHLGLWVWGEILRMFVEVTQYVVRRLGFSDMFYVLHLLELLQRTIGLAAGVASS